MAQGGMSRIMGRYALKQVYDALVGQRTEKHAASFARQHTPGADHLELGVESERTGISPMA